MINLVHLRNIKCFSDINIPFAPLTVLSGINGMGKSTVIQSLLLLRQSIISQTINKEGMLLNGPLVSLGNSEDVLYEQAIDNDLIHIEIQEDFKRTYSYIFRFEKGNNILPVTDNQGKKNPFSLKGEHFFYLKAERIGPRTSSCCIDHEMNRYNNIGNAGEYCAYILSQVASKQKVFKTLLHPTEEQNLLRPQVEAWLSEIGQSLRINSTIQTSMDLVEMEFSFLQDKTWSKDYRATNVGFGLTYSLPIFVACLSAKPETLVVIENPEAHLHPKGQVAIGKFLAQTASCGTQIIIETHSDHVLNGIRIAVKNGIIKSDQIALNFFDRSPISPDSTLITPKLDKDGRLDQWPDGFFDEWEKGLAELL